MDKTVEPIITSIPIWETKTWNAIQDKDFETAKNNLRDFLLTFSEEEWGGIFWGVILDGIPAVRGYLDEDIWQEKAVPAISQAIFNLAPPSEISNLYNSLNLQAVQKIHNGLLKSLQAEAPDVKLKVLREKYAKFYAFFLAMPGQVLGMETMPAHSLHAVPPKTELEDRFLSMSYSLRELLFSAPTAETIYRTGEKFHLSPDKISDLSKIFGLAVLGVVPVDQIDEEIHKVLAIDARTSREISAILLEKILQGSIEAIESDRLSYVALEREGMTYDVPVDFSAVESEIPIVKSGKQTKGNMGDENFQNAAPRIRPKSLQAFGFPEQNKKGVSASGAKIGNEPKPFLIYEGTKTNSAPEPRKNAVGFSLPFGFFNKNGGGAEMTAKKMPIARVEVGTGTAGEARSGILGKILKKEQTRTVHYGGAKTEVSPFSRGGSFENEIKIGGATPIDADSVPKTEAKILSVRPEIGEGAKEGVLTIKKISLPDTNPADEPTQKKNPFSFPSKNGNNGPKVSGNTIHLK